jgi:glycosyltransferase involved in cell wall biosynthesis
MDILGGQSVQARMLLGRLGREPGLDVAFLPVNPRLPGPLEVLRRVKYVRTLVTSIAYILLLLVRVPRCGIVHVFSASYFSFVLVPTPAILVARLFRKKVVLNYHSGEAEDHFTRWPSAVRTARLADAIVVQSDYLVRVLARFGLPATAVFNTIEVRDFPFRERAHLRPAFISNWNFESNYDVPCVLRAFARIQSVRPDATLVLAGDGSKRPDVERLLAELNLRGVTMTGSVPTDRMPALYDAADVFLNGSVVDNMPLSILEAFACGLPVVTTDAGGIPDFVEDGRTALIVPRGDPGAIAAAALRLLDDDGLALRLSRGGSQESRKYTWEQGRDRWLAVYRRLVGVEPRAEAASGASHNWPDRL